MTRSRRFLFAMLTLAALPGCGGYEIDDDVDLELDFFDLFHAHDLHTPYAPGATVRLWAEPWGDASRDSTTWTFESSDPSVVRVVATDGAHAEVVMRSPGTATIVLRGGDDRGVLATATVEVGTPVEAELMWHGELLLHHSEDDARVDDARTLVGESAAFLVRFRDAGGRLLHGHGALGVEASAEAGASTTRTFLGERRDWLVVTPNVEGDHEVRISAGGLPVDAFLVTAVLPPAVANVVVEGQLEQGHRDGDCLVLVAHAEDVDGRPIYGIDYTWDIDGAGLTGFGDVLHYDYDASSPVMVGATFASDRAEAMIHASGGFFVSDSASVGCSAGGASAVGATIPFALLSLVLGWRHRARRLASRTAPQTRA